MWSVVGSGKQGFFRTASFLSPRRSFRTGKRTPHCVILSDIMATDKTFFLETFGCQMNAHDSEKVVGTLEHEGYRRVETEDDADLILYNTCSIRDKAEQKVFNRLNDYKKLYKAGQALRRSGLRGPAGGREDLRARALRLARFRLGLVSKTAGNAGSARSWRERASPASTTARPTKPSKPSSRRGPIRYRGYITIIEGCDKFCAYCVVPYTRGKERSRTSTSVLAEARRMADSGYTEIQLLGQNVNSYLDPEGKHDASRNCWPLSGRFRASAASAL